MTGRCSPTGWRWRPADNALLAVDFLATTPLQIAIVWPDGAATAAAPLLAVLRRHFLATRALAAGPESAIDALAQAIPFVGDKGARKTAARPPMFAVTDAANCR